MRRFSRASSGYSGASFGAFRMTSQLSPGPLNTSSCSAELALVCRDGGVLAVQFVPGLAVGHRRSRGIKSLGHAAVGIHAHVRIHGEIPVVALLRR